MNELAKHTMSSAAVERVDVSTPTTVAKNHAPTSAQALHTAALRRRWRLPPLCWLALALLGMALTPAVLPLPGSWWRVGLAAAVGVCGGLLSLAGIWAFRQGRTTVNPVTPAAASTLVVQGIYRYSRNPMYLGFALVLLAASVYAGKASGLLWCVLFVGAVRRWQIRSEEAALQRKFGRSFEAYCAQVGRWWGRRR